MDIPKIQQYLKEHQLDGWLLADFHGRNEIAVRAMGLSSHLTRRAFYFIPANGEPIALVNPIEQSRFTHVPGRVKTYRGYRGLEADLAKILRGAKRIAMEYSSQGRLPYIGLVDAGTIELVRSFGVETVSSADLVADFQARLSLAQVDSHRRAAKLVNQIKDEAFKFIADALSSGRSINEYDVCKFITDRFKASGLVFDVTPNCSVDANAGNPHYEPTQQSSAPIRKGNLILIDLWARFDNADGVYADITWMGFAGTRAEIPASHAQRFAVVVQARDAALAFLRENIGRRPVLGAEVDDACRAVIEAAGLGPHFTHRTGHSITSNVHGDGPNIDNLETEDGRVLQTGHLFSIEPGVYFVDSGFRTEINCLITENGPEVATLPLQTEIVALF
ncbi:MAG: Xaa-Pro peptidase family protein [Candidatus Zixiibacteriota bacterium]